jgi:ADP-heptose:LPS heptosyltransferase
MAAALRAPCLTLFGPTDHRWTPCDYPLERRVIAEPFLGADSLADDHAAHCAINRITIADVVHTARALVERTSSKV